MLTLLHRYNLVDCNTMHVPATADYLVLWSEIADLYDFFTNAEYSALAERRLLILGGGSNVLFVRERFDGVVLKSLDTSIDVIDDTSEGIVLRVGAATPLDYLVSYASQHQLWGIENLSLIPGSVGGAAVQNAGAYGEEFASAIERVICFDISQAKTVVIPVADLGYGYRDTLFKHSPAKERFIITKVDVRLSRFATPKLDYGRLAELVAPAGDSLTPADVRRAVIDIRRSKLPDPDKIGSAGSFFRNPVLGSADFDRFIMRAAAAGYSPSDIPAYPAGNGARKLSAAWLIDKSGLKGYTSGNVATWFDQPLVIVNLTGHAAGEEIEAFAAYISDTVFSKWGVRLTPEVEFLKIV